MVDALFGPLPGWITDEFGTVFSIECWILLTFLGFPDSSRNTAPKLRSLGWRPILRNFSIFLQPKASIGFLYAIHRNSFLLPAMIGATHDLERN